jgi:hypothetical protein
MITVGTAYDAIRHALNSVGSAHPAEIDIANHAGAILYGGPWRWRERKLWQVNLGAGSERINLPSDVGDVIDVKAAVSGTAIYRFVADYAVIQNLKTLDTAPTQVFTIAPLFEPDLNGEVISKLAIYPAPSTSESRALTVLGRAKWPRLTGSTTDKTALPFPQSMPIFETLYLELCRAYARGYEFDERTRVDDEVARVMTGPIWLQALEADRQAFATATMMRNTWTRPDRLVDAIVTQYPNFD